MTADHHDQADESDLAALTRIAACPDGATPIHATVVVSYLDHQGEPCMGMATRGDSTLTDRLGLFTWAQARLLRSHLDHQDDDGD